MHDYYKIHAHYSFAVIPMHSEFFQHIIALAIVLIFLRLSHDYVIFIMLLQFLCNYLIDATLSVFLCLCFIALASFVQHNLIAITIMLIELKSCPCDPASITIIAHMLFIINVVGSFTTNP